MTAPRTVLIVEDDAAQGQILAEGLSLENAFAVTLAATLREADALLAAPDAHFDAIILDLGMPDGDGHSYCTSLRRQGHEMPIIFATGSCDEADVVRGFEAGANDYVVKPVRLQELQARLEAQLRVFDNSESAVFTIGPYTFRPAARVLVDPTKNRRLRLTSKETAILKFLYHAGPQRVTRPVLLDKVWGYNSGVTSHTLETHIYRLRQKIEANTADCRLLVTVVGGYQLNASIAASDAHSNGQSG